MASTVKRDVGLAVLRILPSLMLLGHGVGKFSDLLRGDFEFPDPIGIGSAPSLFLAVIAEFVCPILIIIGFKTRLASIPPIINMVVAAFIFHSGDPFNAKEKALLYLVFFIAIMLLGPGKYSLDRK